MPAKKKTARRSPKETKEKVTRRPEDRVIHIFMPYILGILALFLGLCFILGEKNLGFLGKISTLLLGLFSVGAYASPLLLLLHAVFYRRDLAAGSHLYKFWFTFGNMTFLGALYAQFFCESTPFDLKTYYLQGTQLSSGGAVGSAVQFALGKVLGVFAPVVGILAVVLFTSFLFGKTPAELIRSVLAPLGEKWREGREERRDRQAEDRAAREAERLRLAEERAAEKYRVKEEAKQKKKEKKTAVAMESGEEVTGEIPEEHVSEEEMKIRLPLEDEEEMRARLEAAEEEAKRREIRPIEEIESVPVPSLKDELADLFSNVPEGAAVVPESELEPELLQSQAEIRMNLEAKKAALTVELPEEEETEPEEPAKKPYRFPALALLPAPKKSDGASRMEQDATAKKLVDTLMNFGVKTTICGIAKGPAVTRYEIQPQPGVRVRSIVNLTDDIALALAAGGVRIEAPIPGKEAVGIEVPNRNRDIVYIRELIEKEEFTSAASRLQCCLGKDVAGKPIYCDLVKMPHILIAGATGMGKSVCLNSMIVSILYHATPDEVQMILIDPKKVEMGKYNGIPHLLVPVVSDSKKAAGALNWAVIEMEKRFIEMEEVGVRDIKSYNEITKNDPEKRHMSHIVIIIDELADLMMTARDEVETSICRLAQKARAAGMHLVIGTQRPSVDVITGLIKANVPSRIACTVASQVDSRTIIDIQGAEKLLGKGDMLYAPVGLAKPMRVQGCFVDEKEIEAVCDFVRSQRPASYDESVSNLIEREAAKCGEKKKGGFFDADGEGDPTSVGLFADKDPLLEKAIDVAVTERKVSTSLLQRKLSVGYARAAKLIDFMAEMNVVGPYAGSKPREVLWTKQYYDEYKMRALEEAPIH